MTKKLIITEEQLQKLSEYMISNKLFEGEFKLDTADQTQIDHIFDIFKQSYEKSTGGSWDKSKFISRASNWSFFGDVDGFIALRPQKSGLYKLVGVAGSPKSILNALNEIEAKKIPVWGMVNQNIQAMLQKKGFITPTPQQLQILYKSIPASVFGGADVQQNPDGSLTLKYNDVGDATKFFVGNETYFNTMKTMFGDKFNLDEARSNPEKNPRVTFGMFMDNLVNKHPYENIFVSFRNDLHVTDVNPNNKYETPTGVYSYPLIGYFPDKEAILKSTEQEFRSIFPYQNKLPYMYFIILKDRQGILDDTTSFETLAGYVKKIDEIYGSQIEPVHELCNLYLKKQYKSTYQDAPTHDTHEFWLFLYSIAPYISKTNKKVNVIKFICDKIGVRGFIDLKGDGYIHPAEKKQAVFFKVKTIADVVTFKTQIIEPKDRIESMINKLGPDKKNQGVVDQILSIYDPSKFTPELIKKIVKISDKPAELAYTLLHNRLNNFDYNTTSLVHDVIEIVRHISDPGSMDDFLIKLAHYAKLINNDLSISLIFAFAKDKKKLVNSILNSKVKIRSKHLIENLISVAKDDTMVAQSILNNHIDYENITFDDAHVFAVLVNIFGDDFADVILDKISKMELSQDSTDNIIDSLHYGVKDANKFNLKLIDTMAEKLPANYLDAILNISKSDQRGRLIQRYLNKVGYIVSDAIILVLLSFTENKTALLKLLNEHSGLTVKTILSLVHEIKGEEFAYVLNILLNNEEQISDDWLTWLWENSRHKLFKLTDVDRKPLLVKLDQVYMKRFNLHEQISRIKTIMGIDESIRAAEANDQIDSILTVLHHKRNLAFITFGSFSPADKETATKLINSDASINTIHVKKSPFMGFVLYREGHEKEAQELAYLANKYGGFLSADATKEDSIRIGQLLDYDPQDIQDYIEKNYDEFGTNRRTGELFEFDSPNQNPSAISTFDLDEVAKTTEDLPPDTGLYYENNGNEHSLILFAGSTSDKYNFIGSIIFEKYNDDTYNVKRVNAQSGYGPMLYDMALSHIYPASLMPDRSGMVSKEAMNIWRYYTHNRPDIKKEVLKPEKDDEYNLNLVYGEESNMDRDEMIRLTNKPKIVKNWGEDMVLYNTKYSGKPLNVMPLKKVAFNAFKNKTVDRKILRTIANKEFMYTRHSGFKELDDLAADYEEHT